MDTLNIVCVDDQREVLAALRNDLEPFEVHFTIVDCESAGEALEVLDEIDAAGEHAALIVCDHVMPQQNGVDFLCEVNEDGRFSHTKKLLLTGLATHEDTIQAINRAHINCYIEKPWDRDDLTGVIKTLVTEYIVHAGLDYQPLVEFLDQQVLYRTLRNRV